MESLLLLVVGIALGVAVGWLLARMPRTDETVIAPEVLEAQHAAAMAQVRHDEALARAGVETRLATAGATITALREQVAAGEEQRREIAERHRSEALQRTATEQVESKVLQKLAPVAAQLKDMQQKVLDLEKQRSEQHGDLAAQIRATRHSAEQSKMAAETLSSALRNNSVRGAYGELQLKTLVESAGLLNRIDYSVQESISADSGARRPDMVIKLPGRKQVAIDSKVPFSAFIDSFRDDISETERKSLQTQHAKQVRGHVDALAGKEYWTGLPVSPEYTIAFIPSEAILNTALEADPTLLEYAFSRGIVLATPVNLWATLKTVALTWKQEDLAENAQELVDLGRELYKRLGKLSDHVSKLGRSIETTVRSYNDFAGSLEGRVLVTARKLDGIDEAKMLGEVKQIEGDTRRLTASEFTVLEETGIGRPEIDFEQTGLPVETNDERAG
ncbi:DNA recombination protein RmuC [Aeromicrobium sp.]|uniref:DNA recombination protein RmuC n=1 Tax=Aeromicrobium sp. TaxID=1871063 RepID=UPI0030C032CE